MSVSDNVIHLQEFKRESKQELIDDIGARTFLFLRDAAEEWDVPIKEVIVEHMLGLTLVMSTVEGKEEAQRVLDRISRKLHLQA